MLPSFPKIEAARHLLNFQMVEFLAHQIDPLLRNIDRHIQFEGSETTVLRYDDTTSHTVFEPISAEIRIDRISLDNFTPVYLLGKLKHIAEQMAKGASTILFEEMERGTAETGNVIDAQGQSLNEDLILRAMETMEHSFRPDGTWIPPTLVVAPDMFNRLVQLSDGNQSGSSKYQESLKKILEKKRDDFRRREIDRILVG